MNRKNEKYKIEQEADFYFSEIKCQKWPDLRVTEMKISLIFVFLFCFERRLLWTGAHAVRVRKRATPKVKEMQNILLWTKPIYSNQSIILFGLWRSPNKTKYKHTQNRGKKEKHSNKFIDTNTSHLCVGYSTPSLSIFVDFFLSSCLLFFEIDLYISFAVCQHGCCFVVDVDNGGKENRHVFERCTIHCDKSSDYFDMYGL